MAPMVAIIALLTIVLITLLINRIATMALMFTGLSREMARFQARSAFATVGFTSAESEYVVNHPVRRRIIMLLMLLGNIGFVSTMGLVIATLTGTSDYPLASRLGVLVAGLAGLWALSMSKVVDVYLSRLIGWALKKFTRLEAHDFLNLLQLGAGYGVTEMEVEERDWLVGKKLEQLRFPDAGILVLGIRRSDGTFEGSPTGSTYVRRNDKLIIYGRQDDIIALDERRQRPSGEQEHLTLLAQRRQAAPDARQEGDRA